MREPRIYCPECSWRPSMEDRWVCMPGCGVRWHTFWTAGLCPGCRHRWQHTQCLACLAISRHRDWYHWPEERRAARRSRNLIELPSRD